MNHGLNNITGVKHHSIPDNMEELSLSEYLNPFQGHFIYTNLYQKTITPPHFFILIGVSWG